MANWAMAQTATIQRDRILEFPALEDRDGRLGNVVAVEIRCPISVEERGGTGLHCENQK